MSFHNSDFGNRFIESILSGFPGFGGSGGNQQGATQADANAIFAGFETFGPPEGSQDIFAPGFGPEGQLTPGAFGTDEFAGTGTQPTNPSSSVADFSVDDPNLNALIQAVATLLGREDSSRTAATNSALTALQTERLSFEGQLTAFQAMLDEQLPSNPFSDEVLENRRQNVNDRILREIGQIQGIAGDQLSARGFQGGGQLSGASALIQSGGLQARATALTSLQKEQEDVNNQRDVFRAGLIAPFQTEQQRIGANITGLEAQLKANNIFDSTESINFLEGIVGDQSGLDQKQALIDLVTKLQEEGETDLAESVLSAIAGFVSVDAPAFGAGLQFLANPISDLIDEFLNPFFNNTNLGG